MDPNYHRLRNWVARGLTPFLGYEDDGAMADYFLGIKSEKKLREYAEGTLGASAELDKFIKELAARKKELQSTTNLPEGMAELQRSESDLFHSESLPTGKDKTPDQSQVKAKPKKQSQDEKKDSKKNLKNLKKKKILKPPILQ